VVTSNRKIVLSEGQNKKKMFFMWG